MSNPPKKWILLKEQKPTPFDLINFRDAAGNEQLGWWDGYKCTFGKQKIGTPTEFRRDIFRVDLNQRDIETHPRIYSYPGRQDGKTPVHKSRSS